MIILISQYFSLRLMFAFFSLFTTLHSYMIARLRTLDFAILGFKNAKTEIQLFLFSEQRLPVLISVSKNIVGSTAGGLRKMTFSEAL